MKRGVFHFLTDMEMDLHWLECIGGLMVARRCARPLHAKLDWPGLSGCLYGLLERAVMGSEIALADAKQLAMLMSECGAGGSEPDTWVPIGRIISARADSLESAVSHAERARPRIIYLPKTAATLPPPHHRGNLEDCLGALRSGACSLSTIGLILQAHGERDEPLDWPLLERMVKHKLEGDTRLLRRVQRCAKGKPYEEATESLSWATVGLIVLGLATGLEGAVSAACRATRTLIIYSDPKAATGSAGAQPGQAAVKAEPAARGEG
jgi:hypothetical protein